jgi:hypothetical protein
MVTTSGNSIHLPIRNPPLTCYIVCSRKGYVSDRVLAYASKIFRNAHAMYA